MIISTASQVAVGAVTLGTTDAAGVEWYWLGIDGWGAPKSTGQPTQRPSADGGVSSKPFKQYRTFSIYGALVAPSRAAMLAAIDGLAVAADIIATTVTVSDGGTTRTVFAQRQDEILLKETSDVSVEFTLQFYAVDPRKFGDALTGSTGLPSTSGGLTVPLTIPFTINATTVSGSVTLTNPGNTAGKVQLRIDGQVTGPVVSQSSAAGSKSLVFSSAYPIASGNWLEYNCDPASGPTITENGQSSRRRYLTTAEWFDFEPGVNTFSLTAASSSGGALLTVTAYPAWD